jgi:hypothetical protein
MVRARIGCITATMQTTAKIGIAWSVSLLEPLGTIPGRGKRDRVPNFLRTADPASVIAAWSMPPPCAATRLLRKRSVVVRFVRSALKIVNNPPPPPTPAEQVKPEREEEEEEEEFFNHYKNDLKRHAHTLSR